MLSRATRTYNEFMEMVCPSCGAKHESDDFPDAFEVQCACGYSILLPDPNMVQSIPESDSQSGFSGSAAALEAEDEALQVPLEERGESDPLDGMIKVSEEMTGPEDLPQEMPYDPFEVPGVDADMANPEEERDYSSDESLELGEGGITPLSFSDDASLDGESDKEGAAKYETIPEDTTPPAQKIVERAQLASMGQLIGFSYNLEWTELDAESLKRVKHRCLPILEQRPWLETELKHRGIEFSSLETQKGLKNVPETLALEIYLGILELGGKCLYERLSGH